MQTSHRPLKVLILWANDQSANLGVRVLAEGAEALARRAWGSSTEIAFQDYGPSPEDGVAFAGKPVLRDLISRNGAISTKISAFDVVLDTGAGDSFADIYGLKRLAWMANASRVAKKVSTPVVLTPQTLGPFSTRIGRAAGRYVLRNASRVHARDSTSFDYATQLGRQPEVLATDMVFLLPTPVVEQTYDVALNVSGLLWRENPHVDSAKYQRVIRELIQTLQSDGREVTLLAHVLQNETSDSDHRAVQALSREYDLPLILPDSLAEARTAIAGSKIVVGSRMHACLNALSVGVPSIPLAYSRKFDPLMRGIAWERTVDLRDSENIVPDVMDHLRTPPDRLAHEVSTTRSLVDARMDEAVESLAAMQFVRQRQA